MVTRRDMSLLKIIITATLILMLLACGELGQLAKSVNIQKPKVSLSDVKLTSISLDQLDLAVGLDIDNQNPVSIKLAGFDYKLLIEGSEFIKGVQDESVTIGAKNVKTLVVPMSFKFTELQKISEDLVNKDELAIEIKTTARIDIPVLGVQTFPSSIKAGLPIPHMPKLTIEQLSIDKLSLTGVALRLTLGIENTNIFGVDLSKIDYKLAVNGKQWLQSALQQPISLKAKGSTSVEIPLQLNLLQMGNTLYQSLSQSEPLPYELKGNLQLDTTLPMLKGVQTPFEHAGIIAVK